MFKCLERLDHRLPPNVLVCLRFGRDFKDEARSHNDRSQESGRAIYGCGVQVTQHIFDTLKSRDRFHAVPKRDAKVAGAVIWSRHRRRRQRARRRVYLAGMMWTQTP
jgi:hypothetical protein